VTCVSDGDADDFIRLASYDWLVTRRWRFLHAVPGDAWTGEHRDDMARDWNVTRPARLACGQVAGALFIPGPFSRMALPRCAGCCRALGGPPGNGSPKNCGEWREILGLPVT